MPKSKRAKVVHLSKVEKKGKELSQRLFGNVREAAENHQYCFCFSVDNMRNTYLKDVRKQFPDSRLFFGKTKVMAKSLGSNAEEEHLPNLSDLTPHLTGNVGLFFTSRAPEDILFFFSEYVQTDFARAGTEATRTITIPEGTIYSRGGEVSVEEDVPLQHSIEPSLRSWGMTTRLTKGKITLDAPYTICEEGQTLNSHQTAMLKMFGITMAEFRLRIKAYYNSASQEVVEVDPDEM